MLRSKAVNYSHNAKDFKKMKKLKNTQSHTKSIQKGVIRHDMATTQPTNSQIDHPKKRKIYPN